MSARIPVVPSSLQESTENQHFSLYDRLLQERLIFLNQAIDSEIANQAIAAMLYLDATHTDRNIHLYINARGYEGRDSLTAGLALYDTMQCLNSDVMTVCAGTTTGIATFLLAAGAADKRRALPHARILLSQPRAMTGERSATDIDIAAQELLQQRQTLAEILAKRTGRSVEQIFADTQRENYLSAQDALEYGLIDTIVESSGSN